MAEYKPLFMYLEPASIPQVVAHIQKYLAENPIISDEETIAELIREYIADHPEIIAVASVNGKVGAVVLTGSDIMINASSAVSVETQLLNLASMINNTGADITQIEANISQIYTTIGTLQTNVETNASNISALQTSVEGQGTRLAAAETDIDNLETAQTAQGTRINNIEGNVSSIRTRLSQAENDITDLENNDETLSTRLNAVEADTSDYEPRISVNEALLNGISRKYTTSTTSWVVGFYLSAWGLVVPTTSGWNLTISNSQVLVGGTWYPINLSSISTVPVGRFIVFDAPTGVQCVDGTAYMVSLAVQAD